MLSVTAQSRLHPHVQPQESSEDPDTHLMDTDSHAPDTHMTSHTASCSTTSVRKKTSTLISYRVRLILFSLLLNDVYYITLLFSSSRAFTLNLDFFQKERIL